MSFNYNAISDSVASMMEKLEQFLVSKTVVGEKIVIGDVTLIPFISLGFGTGTGLGDGQDEKATKGSGGGGGIGASIKPIAVLVIKGDDIKMLPVRGARRLPGGPALPGRGACGRTRAAWPPCLRPVRGRQ